MTTNVRDSQLAEEFQVLQAEADDFAAIFNSARSEIGHVIVGQERVIEETLTAREAEEWLAKIGLPGKREATGERGADKA